MSNHSQGEPPSPLKPNAEEQKQKLENSPNKAEFIRKLTDGTGKRNRRSRSHLSVNQPSPNRISDADLQEANAGNNVLNMTTRQSQKQSVLVKRVFGDGRVVSGLDNFGQRSELIEEDQGTLGSQPGSAKDLAARAESNVVNYDPPAGNDSRLRSTMYITGKSQRFALKQKEKSPNVGNTMIINLGDKTQVNFKHEVDGNMLVGVTDIETGASRVKHPSGNNFNPKIKPKQGLRDRSGSLHSNESQRNKSGNKSHLKEVSAQFVGSPLEVVDDASQNPSSLQVVDPGVQNSQQSLHPGKMMDPMMISSLSPGRKVSNSPPAKRVNNPPLDSQNTPIVQIQVQEPKGNKKFQKPKLTNLQVKNVDARSMIPQQFGSYEGQQQTNQASKSPTIRGRRNSLQNGPSEKKNVPGQSLNRIKAVPQQHSDLKSFHQRQAQQYKEFIKKNEGVPKYHDASQSTLMNAYIVDDEVIDKSISLGPNQVHQGTQPSDIMMQSLENQLEQLKQATDTNRSFFKAHGNANEIKLLETVRSDHSVPLAQSQESPSIQTKNIISANVTGLEGFKIDQSASINRGMLSTYRGNDNMKLKIIDHSVLVRDQNSNSPSMSSPLRHQLAEGGVRGIDLEQMSVNQDSQHTQPMGRLEQGSQQVAAYIPEPSPLEQSIMSKASPMSKIESFRALLRQESMQNELRIVNNQDNFRNLINPEVTKREFKMIESSPSQKEFFLANSQNQQLLNKKENMLHTVTNEFLDDRYPMSAHRRNQPVKATNRIQVDPQEFRAKLQKKIEELRRLEISESWIMRELQSREQSDMSQPFGTIRENLKESIDSTGDDQNNLFMTFLKHGQREKQGSVVPEITSGQQKLAKGARTLRQQSLEAKHASQNLPLISPTTGQQGSLYQKHGTIGPNENRKMVSIKMTDEDEEDVSEFSRHQNKLPFAMSAILPTSFADNMTGQQLNPETVKSGVTLASSGSANTLKRISKRYTREQRIVIFEDGQSICKETPCLQIELNELLRKFYLRQNGDSELTTNQEDINAQLKLYERAVREILDQCGSRLFLENELTPEMITKLNGAAPKRFSALYTVFGEKINSLIQIDEDVVMLVAGQKDAFKGLKTEKLFIDEEAAQDMFNRIVTSSPIRFDRKSVMTTLSKSPSSILRRGRTVGGDSPTKTFKLTEMDQPDPMLSPKKQSHSRNYVSQTSRDIIKASKQEILDRLIKKPGDVNLKGHLSAGSNTMRAKRLAQITLVTKGIKRGKLPPIKSPKQLDVFVFGEKDSVRVLRNKNEIITSTPKMQKVKIQQHEAASAINVMAVTEETRVDQIERSKERRGTQFHLQTGQSLLNSIKQDVSITTSHRNEPLSSMSNVQAREHEVLSDQHLTEAVQTDLRKQLENVHSIQLIDQRNASAATHKTESSQLYTEPKEIVSDANINVAKRALRDRSPSYMHQKLVSNTSMQDNSAKLKVKYKLTKRDKDKIKAEVNEHVLQNALRQRSDWREKHKLDDKQLYKLFSEFSSMMQIFRTQENDKDPDSFKSKMAKLNKQIGLQEEDPLSTLFPMNSNLSSLKYNRMQKEEEHKTYKLKKSDYREFQVPVQVCIDYSEVLRPTKMALRRTVLNALGINSNHKGAKMSYDQFLRLNSFLLFNTGSHEDYIWFCVRLFDPQLSGFAAISECETVIDLLFDNQDEEGNTTKPPKVDLPARGTSVNDDSVSKSSVGGVDAAEKSVRVDSEDPSESEDGIESEKEEDAQGSVSQAASKAKRKGVVPEDENKDESVASNIKKICHDRRIFKKTGFLDPEALAQAFKDRLLDVEDFKSALK